MGPLASLVTFVFIVTGLFVHAKCGSCIGLNRTPLGDLVCSVLYCSENER